MSQPINNVLSNWLDHRMSKQGSMLSNIGNFLSKVPKGAGKAAKIGVGAGILGLTGEAGVKTVNNWAHGNPSMAEPTFAEDQVGHLANTAATVTGFRPLLQTAAQSAANGLDMSPPAQKWLDAASNITNPQVRQQILNDTLQAASDGGTAVAQNVGNVAGNTIGRSLGHGLANGIWDDMAHHPFLTLGGAALFGAGPAVAYDAVTYKRRKEEAERNKAIMRYILKQEKQGMVKEAGIGSYLMDALRKGEQVMPGMQGTPKADKIEQLFSKYIYRPTGSTPGKLNEVLKKYEGKDFIPNSALDKAKGFPQTLINNSLTRNPVKTAIGTSAGLGTAVTAEQARSPDPQYNGMYDTRGHFIKNWIKNMGVIPNSLVKAVELGAVKNIPLTGPTADKLQHIKYNVMSGDKHPPIPPPNDQNYMPPHFGLSDKTVDHLKNDNIIGMSPTPDESQSKWRDALPYIGAAGLATVPLPAYMMYRRYADKKLNKLEGDNTKLQQKTELANQQASVQ